MAGTDILIGTRKYGGKVIQSYSACYFSKNNTLIKTILPQQPGIYRKYKGNVIESHGMYVHAYMCHT